jgi:hypothetical protein
MPWKVEIPVPAGGLGKRLEAMHDFHALREITACLGRGRRRRSRDDRQDYLRWYFADHATAASFAVEFDGKLL